MARQTTKRKVRQAKALRRNMTLPEVLMWRELRQSDLKFRRQHPIGPYVVDFYCAAAKLAIEVDGIAHDMGAMPCKDAARDEAIQSRGIKTVRISANEILSSPTSSAEAILAVCRERLN